MLKDKWTIILTTFIFLTFIVGTVSYGNANDIIVSADYLITGLLCGILFANIQRIKFMNNLKAIHDSHALEISYYEKSLTSLVERERRDHFINGTSISNDVD